MRTTMTSIFAPVCCVHSITVISYTCVNCCCCDMSRMKKVYYQYYYYYFYLCPLKLH